MFSPRLIFSIIWLIQVVLHVALHDLFFSFSETTWFAVILLFLFFLFGTLLVALPRDFVEVFSLQDNFEIHRFFRYFVIIYIVFSVFAVFEVYRMLDDLSGGDFSAEVIRKLVVNDFVEERILYGYLRVFYLGVGFSIFFLAYSKYFSPGQIIAILGIGLASAIATTGRLYILLFFVASTALLYRNKVISIHTVFFGIFLFVFLFFGLAILFDKGEMATFGGNILWNAQVYIMSSMACLNDYVVSGNQEISGGAILPNPIREFLSIFGFSIPLKPALHPFSEVPIDCNTYTVLFPFFHDGGLLGVLLGAVFLGLFHQYLYLRFKTSINPMWWYFYAISIYPLVMSIFEDAYFSSPGFWLLLCLPPMIYFFLFKINLKS